MSARAPIDETVLAALSIALPRVAGVTVLRNEPIDRVLTLRTGGPADLLVHVETPEALSGATELLKRVRCPWRVCWPFSTMVAREGGVRGAVLTLGAGFDQLQTGPDGSVILGAITPFSALSAAGPAFSTLASWSGTPGALFACGESHRLAGTCAGVTVVSGDSVRRRTVAATAAPPNLARTTSLVSVQLRPVPPAASAPLLPGQLLAPDTAMLNAGGTTHHIAITLSEPDLCESRLRGWTLSQAWPGLVVQSGEGTAADLELLARALSEKLLREHVMVTKPAIRVFGRTPQNPSPRKR
ncbi:MAG: hypothetical protein CL927_08290 [Deltaproteobacteria bacterium]|nr:hypothetical protein [Deltaproteobacteria bacterium]HCH62493.1 hypothetical protein [Deltaproteobacteria bacterium]